MYKIVPSVHVLRSTRLKLPATIFKMWRFGLSGDDKAKEGKAKEGKAKEGKAKKTKERTERKKISITDKNAEKKKSLKMLAPSNLAQAKDRRGSIMAAEHLIMRRSSRASRQFNPLEFAGLSHVAAGAIPLDMPKSVQKYRRSSIVTNRLNKVKEIQDRVNKAVKDYETVPIEDAAEANYLIKDIEENLFNIEDDMLRINVSILLEKFRKMSLQLKDDMRYLNASRTGDRKRELLESLQTWMDEDHFDDLEDDEPRSDSPIADSDMVTGYITQVELNMKKVAGLEDKIKQLKSHGGDTVHLERQRKNLQRQLNQDVLDSEFRRRHSKADSGKKQEFTYLKNAANEIYDLLNRTRMEGMAESHHFEDNLKKILAQMEEKDRDIEYLEKRVNQQKLLVKQWYNDYEKLQNDHFLTKDEVLVERKQTKRLQSEIEKIKKQSTESDKKKKASKSEKENKSKDAEQINVIKQKLEVVTWTLKEKDEQIEEQHRHIQQLKSALRKNSSFHLNPTEALYRPVEREPSKSSNGKRETPPSNHNLNPVEVSISNRGVPPPTPSTAGGTREELEVLRSRIASLEKEKQILQERTKKESETHLTITKVETKYKRAFFDQNTQTESGETQDDVTPAVQMTSQETQTKSVPTMQYKTAKERRNLYQVAQEMSQQLGPKWIESAKVLKDLEMDDIRELEQGGSPQEEEDDVNDAAEKQKIHELQEARDELISCRVTTSIRELAGEMLGGKDPLLLEESNLASINTMHSEMENMMKSVTGFVNKAQAVIGCQTGMMNEANEEIKKNLPLNVQKQLEKNKSKGGIPSQTSLPCSEHSQEWKDMSLTEQIRCKLKVVEESMKTNINEVMNVYINEVAKQHAEYSDIHTSIQDDSRLEIKKVVGDPGSAVRNMQNKVESSVRYMARVTRAERGPTNQLPRHISTAQVQEMGEGANLAHQHAGRQVGTWTAVGRRPTRVFHAQTAPEEPQQPLSLFGHAATAAQKKSQQQTKPSTTDGGGRGGGRPRDFQLARVRRAKLKPELRGLGMIVKSTGVQRDVPQTIAATGLNRIGSIGAGPIPIPLTQSYQDPRPRLRFGENRGEELMTFSDIQQQLTVQAAKPQQTRRTGTIERFRSTPTPHQPIGPTMIISHAAKQAARDIKLPKIF